MLTTAERNWAAIAHGSAVLTLIVALSTGGIAGLLGLLVPLLIYLAYYRTSRYVAFHALQALAFQASAFILVLVGGALGGGFIAIAWVIVALLSVVIVGLILIPGAIGFTITFGLLLGLLPFGLAAYGIVGSYKAYGGEDFEYPYIGNVVRQQVYFTPPNVDASAAS